MGAQTIAAVLTLSGAATLTVCVMLVLRRKRRKHRDKSFPRRWSYTSVGLVRGAFPSFVDFPEFVIHTALFFEVCPTKEDILTDVIPKIIQYERFAHVPDWKAESCKPLENLDVSRLVRTVTIDCDQSGVLTALEDLVRQPLTLEGRDDLPWWEFVILDNKGTGRSIVVWRVHHALADGLSILTLAEQIATCKDGTALKDMIPEAMLKRPKLRKPWYEAIGKAMFAVGDALALSSIGCDDDNLFSKGSYDGMTHNHNRKIFRFEPIPLDFVKALKRAGGVSFNDVVYTCFCNAIQGYLDIESCPVYKEKGRSVKCRSVTPVARARSAEVQTDKARAMNNQWCLVSLAMPMGYEDIVEQMRVVHRTTKRALSGPLVALQLGLQNHVAKLLPVSVAKNLVYGTIWRHSVSFSNVPGPREPCLLAGREVSEVQVVLANLHSQVCLASYGGNLCGNITLDPEAVPNAELIPLLFSRAFQRLAEKLGVECPDSLVDHASQLNSS